MWAAKGRGPFVARYPGFRIPDSAAVVPHWASELSQIFQCETAVNLGVFELSPCQPVDPSWSNLDDDSRTPIFPELRSLKIAKVQK